MILPVFVLNPKNAVEMIKLLLDLNRHPLSGISLMRYFNKIKTIWESDHVSEGIWRYIIPTVLKSPSLLR